MILGGCAALGLVLAQRKGHSFLRAGGAFALVLSQVILLLLGKGLFVWYGLALVAFSFMALRPVEGLAVSLLAWLLQYGPWVGPAVTSEIRIRSAMWVAFLLAVGTLAVVRLNDPSSIEHQGTRYDEL
jgi:hypothetical protein